MNKTWNETLYDAWGQRHDIDKVYFEFDTGHQQLMIFHNALFGRVMVLDGVVQTTEKDEFIYHEMLTHVPRPALWLAQMQTLHEIGLLFPGQ